MNIKQYFFAKTDFTDANARTQCLYRLRLFYRNYLTENTFLLFFNSQLQVKITYKAILLTIYFSQRK